MNHDFASLHFRVQPRVQSDSQFVSGKMNRPFYNALHEQIFIS